MRANIQASVDHLRHGSIERLAEHDGLVVIGSGLDLVSGEVSFFDGAPDSLA
jgi:hypothetical protein